MLFKSGFNSCNEFDSMGCEDEGIKNKLSVKKVKFETKNSYGKYILY